MPSFRRWVLALLYSKDTGVINAIDEQAFVVVHDVRDVFGGSFAWDESPKSEVK